MRARALVGAPLAAALVRAGCESETAAESEPAWEYDTASGSETAPAAEPAVIRAESPGGLPQDGAVVLACFPRVLLAAGAPTVAGCPASQDDSVPNAPCP